MIPFLLSAFLISSDVATPPTAAVAPVAAKASEKEKRVCRAPTTQTESRMRRKLCLTPTEWAVRDAGKSANDLKNIGAR